MAKQSLILEFLAFLKQEKTAREWKAALRTLGPGKQKYRIYIENLLRRIQTNPKYDPSAKWRLLPPSFSRRRLEVDLWAVQIESMSC